MSPVNQFISLSREAPECQNQIPKFLVTIGTYEKTILMFNQHSVSKMGIQVAKDIKWLRKSSFTKKRK